MKARTPWKSFSFAIVNYWSVALSTLGYSAAILVILAYKLSSLTATTFSTGEISARTQAAKFQTVRSNPLFAPHKGLQFLLQHFKHHGPLAMRSVSTMFAILVVLCFYYVLLQWYTKRIAVIGTLLLLTSSWFLHISRLSTTEIMFTMLFVLFATGVWLQQSRTNRSAVFVSALVATFLLYIPAMIWFVLPVVIWQRRRIAGAFERLAVWQIIVIVFLGGGLLLPLGWALITQAGLYKSWLGLPEHWLTLSQMGKNLLHIPGQLFWRGPADPAKWLGRLPLIDWLGIVMLAVGLYAYWFKLHLDRTWFLIYIAVVGSILITIGGPVTIAILLPFVYLVIASGVALMLQQWFTIFPRNPFARSLGTTLLIIAVAASCFYNLTNYFVAWPHAPATKAAFQQRP